MHLKSQYNAIQGRRPAAEEPPRPPSLHSLAGEAGEQMEQAFMGFRNLGILSSLNLMRFNGNMMG